MPIACCTAVKLAVEDAGAGELLDVLQQARAEAGERVEAVGDEELEGGIEARRAHQLGVRRWRLSQRS